MIKHVHHRTDSTFFTENAGPQQSDYLESLEQVFQVLNKVPIVTSSFLNLDDIEHDLGQNDSAVAILKERMAYTHSLNIRSLQVYNTLLDKLAVTMKRYEDNLDEYRTKLEGLKKEILGLRKDTLIGQIFKDTALHTVFTPQLKRLRSKWREADSLLKSSTNVINNLKSRVAANNITIADLLFQVDAISDDLRYNAFGKEQSYLWEPPSFSVDSGAVEQDNRSRRYTGEKKLARYYFMNTSNIRFLLAITLAIYFYWVWFNFRSLRRLGKLSSINEFHFHYISPLPVIACLVFTLNLAPLFDPRAPAVYIEYSQLLLVLALGILFYRRLPKHYFMLWCIFIVLSFTLYFAESGHLLATYSGRWVRLMLNAVSAALAVYFFFTSKEKPGRSWLVRFAVIIYLALHLTAIVCNLLGRVTLSQIAGSTAAFSLSSAIGLMVFVQLITETFLLQIQSSRMRKNYPDSFEFVGIARSITKLMGIVAAIVWLIVVTNSLNVYDMLGDTLSGLFNTPRSVGKISFTFNGILLFLGIIWIANFFQKYIAYFFGDTGDDASIDDRNQRSRLLVTRLVLLIAGFFLAVAASGLPIDKITFVLGALGVGIGLGLQGIINNFVSGIIIIFDRPIRLGDTVEVGGKKGRVKEISIRSSTILTDEGAEVIIPNGDVLSHNIINWTLSNNQVRATLSFNLDKTTYTDAIQPDIKELVKTIPGIFLRKEPELAIEHVTSKAVRLKVSFWCTDVGSSSATSAAAREAIYNYLEKKGIEVS
ncbi:mechanosensitive ion channel family protein [Hydrobacter penzbergensis]|nr:mechanosensitive ion channel domain-containing protein [Hydrobacter penzbergensis]